MLLAGVWLPRQCSLAHPRPGPYLPAAVFSAASHTARAAAMSPAFASQSAQYCVSLRRAGGEEGVWMLEAGDREGL